MKQTILISFLLIASLVRANDLCDSGVPAVAEETTLADVMQWNPVTELGEEDYRYLSDRKVRRVFFDSVLFSTLAHLPLYCMALDGATRRPIEISTIMFNGLALTSALLSWHVAHYFGASGKNELIGFERTLKHKFEISANEVVRRHLILLENNLESFAENLEADDIEHLPRPMQALIAEESRPQSAAALIRAMSKVRVRRLAEFWKHFLSKPKGQVWYQEWTRLSQQVQQGMARSGITRNTSRLVKERLAICTAMLATIPRGLVADRAFAH
jgi:hypothetical protein